ncbi:MAG: ATP phosphoribosyltransferase [Proteobacteria bacterium]|nr:ATP phosphoribosyltransferase [Pseudomonadota bacterium]
MLKIALPNKGALSEEAALLMGEAGYECKRYRRELSVLDKEHELEFVFLRPRDIAVYVSRGILDMGITGRDLAREACVDLHEVLPLGFGRSRFFYAVPENSELTPETFNGLRIATSFPNLLRQNLNARKIDAEIITLDGAVEISVSLGVADAVADVVETGRTLSQAGLKVVGSPLLESEAVVVARDDINSLSPQLRICIERLKGIVVARDYVMIEYDAPKILLEKVCAITPGIEAPTIAPLSKTEWVAVKAMVKRKEANEIMDRLSAVGARGIVVMDIRACRL